MICQSSVSCLYSLLCLVRVVCRILWCSAPVDIPTFSVESGGELKKIDFYQGRYSSADGVADLDSTVPDRSRRLRAAISADGASFNSFNQFNSVT